MASTLIVEDGTIVANANSYNTIDSLKAYALLRHRVLPDDDELLEGYAIRAMDYIESFKGEFKGTITDVDQVLSFPRTGLFVYDIEVGVNVIPPGIPSAQSQLVIEQVNGVEIQPTFVYAGRIKRKKIGPLETEFFDGAQTGIAPAIASVDTLLAPFMRQFFGLRTLRV